jgi:hypothetical protein
LQQVIAQPWAATAQFNKQLHGHAIAC